MSAVNDTDYRIPAFLPLPGGKEIAFAEKRLPGGCEGDTGYIQLVAKWRTSRSAAWSAESVVCDSTTVVAGVTRGNTCGNPTPVYDAATDTVILVLNQNSGEVTQREPDPGDKECENCGPGARDCRQRGPGDRRTQFVRSRPLSQWSSQTPFVKVSGGTELTAIVQGEGRTWDAVGPGNGVTVSSTKFVFPADDRNIVYSKSPQDGVWRWSQAKLCSTPETCDTRTGEGAVVVMNDGLLRRNDRPSADPMKSTKIGDDIVYRRWSAHQRADLGWSSASPDGGWSAFTSLDQPLMPAHHAPDCGVRAPLCPEFKMDPQTGDCIRVPDENDPNVMVCVPTLIEGKISGVQGSIRRYSQGQDISRLVFSGPAATRDRWGLNVRVSYDEGETWTIGREVIPATEDNFTGYSSIAPVEDGVAIVYERDVANVGSIHYRWISLSALLCGRKEPVYIGGNSWLGNYTRALRRTANTEYSGGGTVNGSSVQVVVTVAAASEFNHRVESNSASLSVGINGAAALPAQVQRSQPGRFVFADGRVLQLDGFAPGKPWCDVGY